jgi:hypothetical protein
MAKNNTPKGPSSKEDGVSWPLDDCIRWVEWRVRELTIRDGNYVDERGRWLLEEKEAGRKRFELEDQVDHYAVWLLKVRDGLSWHQLAYRFFPWATEPGVEGYESRVRRAYNRVEQNHPGSKKFKPAPLTKYSEIVLDAVRSGIIPVYIGPAAPARG